MAKGPAAQLEGLVVGVHPAVEYDVLSGHARVLSVNDETLHMIVSFQYESGGWSETPETLAKLLALRGFGWIGGAFR